MGLNDAKSEHCTLAMAITDVHYVMNSTLGFVQSWSTVMECTQGSRDGLVVIALANED